MNLAMAKDSLLSAKATCIVILICLAYIGFSSFLVGFKTDQIFLSVVFCTLYFASSITRKFILGFAIFIVYWILFDYMKAFPNYNYQDVHIAGLYNFEKHLFGIHSNGLVVTPNEYWRLHNVTFLTVMSGIFYLCWIPVPLAFAGWLFFFNRNQFLRFALTFVLVNMLGFIVYYAYPAAPPWYVQYHGFHFYPATAGNTGGLVKFDAYFHAGIFKSIYAKGSNVFAAMPSLHSSYPVIVLYYGLKNRLGIINLFFGLVMFGIWFAAVYTSHHYVMDVLAGILTAIIGINLFNYIADHVNWAKRSLTGYELLIR